jgi:small-conductance mechanosensitive channel
MNVSAADSTLMWAVFFIVITPIVVIGAGELEGRLRYRDSAYVRALSVLRVWVLPLVAIWLISGAIFGFSALIVRAVATAAVFAIGAELIALVSVFISSITARSVSGVRRSVPRLLLAVPKILVLIFIAWLLLEVVWDVDLSSLFAALGVTTLIISVALQDTLSGIASGFLLMLDRPFQPGDWIQADDIEGKVIDVNWRSSRIENRNKDLVVIPNSNLAGATIINFDEPARLHRVKVDLQVAFSNPPTLAKDMILDAASSVPGVLEEPAPSVHVIQIDDPLMGYEVRMWVDDFAIAPRVESDFRALVWYMSHRHDVPLPSPAFDLYNYDGLEIEAASKPDPAEVRARLIASQLLNEMDDSEIDRLASMSNEYRFAAGEAILTGQDHDSILFTLWDGQARMDLVGPNGYKRTMGTLTSGDVFSRDRSTDDDRYSLRVVAVSDCEVIGTDLDAAGPIIARNPSLLDALTQINSTRARRMSRLIASDGAKAALRAGVDEAVQQ